MGNWMHVCADVALRHVVFWLRRLGISPALPLLNLGYMLANDPGLDVSSLHVEFDGMLRLAIPLPQKEDTDGACTAD